MASGSESASDASQKAIRKQIIEDDSIDVMVSVGNKFFYTVSVPCTL
jgi:type I restriction enzyme M protein